MNKTTPLNLSTVVNTTFQAYKIWWTPTTKNLFMNNTIPLGKGTFHLVQREYAKHYTNPSNLNGCPFDNIPCIEITTLYREAPDGVLFVNCNPSGTDYKHYNANNTQFDKDFFIYDKANNSYFKAVNAFATYLGVRDNYAMIDVFPLVLQNQAVLKAAFNNGTFTQAFDDLLDIFLKNIVQIRPKVIVATNAFVKELFTGSNNSRLKSRHKYNCKKDKRNRVCYQITIDTFETILFCGGMIAGGHQMDTESKERLKRDVKLFLNKGSIQF